MRDTTSFVLRGGNGGHYINADESTVTGEFSELVCIQETVIATITNDIIENAADIAGLTLATGTRIGGLTTSISLTSGGLIAYH